MKKYLIIKAITKTNCFFNKTEDLLNLIDRALLENPLYDLFFINDYFVSGGFAGGEVSGSDRYVILKLK